MELEEAVEYPVVLFKLSNTLFGISSEAITSFVQLTEVHEMPGAPAHMRGLLNLRGNVIALTDLRALMGMKTMLEQTHETVEMLEKRKQDHINWLNELERSVTEKREFRLTTDPHACAFGKWYDSFHTEDNRLRILLNKFAKPHARIHAIADKIHELQLAGQHDQANGIIDHTRQNELREMMGLFVNLSKELEEGIREIVMISDCGEEPVGLIIDEIAAIEQLKLETQSVDSGHYVIGKRVKDDAPVILLNCEWLRRQVHGATAS